MPSRRTLLEAAGISIVPLAGCLSSDTATESEPPTLVPPPGLREGAVTDIMVNAPPEQSVEVTVSAGSWSRELELNADERWKSPDIIGLEETPTVRIKTGGESLSVDWPPEGDSQQVLNVHIEPSGVLIYAVLKDREEIIKRRTENGSQNNRSQTNRRWMD